MESNENTLPISLPAEGPEGLRGLLDSLYQKAQLDVDHTDHFILYRMNNQKSLIRVSMAQQPCKFWYYDLDGRAAPPGVRDVVNQFLLNHFPNVYHPTDFSKQFLDFYELEKHERVFASIENGVFPDHPKDEKSAKERLLHAITHDAWSKIVPISESMKGYGRNNFFSEKFVSEKVFERAATSSINTDAQTRKRSYDQVDKTTSSPDESPTKRRKMK